MNDSNVFAEMLIEVGRITNDLRVDLANNDYLLKRSEEEQKKLVDTCEKYRREISTHQKHIEEWKAKYEALNRDREMQKRTIDDLKVKLTRLRKRKK